jgi:hypothetical protein
VLWAPPLGPSLQCHTVLGSATVIRERLRTNHLPINSQPFARLIYRLPLYSWNMWQNAISLSHQSSRLSCGIKCFWNFLSFLHRWRLMDFLEFSDRELIDSTLSERYSLMLAMGQTWLSCDGMYAKSYTRMFHALVLSLQVRPSFG